MGRVVFGKAARTQIAAGQGGKTRGERLREAAAGNDDIFIRHAVPGVVEPHEHQRAFYQAALRPKPPRPMHAHGGLPYLGMQLHVKQFAQADKGDAGAVDVALPVQSVRPAGDVVTGHGELLYSCLSNNASSSG